MINVFHRKAPLWWASVTAVFLFSTSGAAVGQMVSATDPAMLKLEQLSPKAADERFTDLPLLPLAAAAESAGTAVAPLLRVRGIVTARSKSLFLQDASTNLFAGGLLPESARPGDVVELVGRPVPNPLTPELGFTGYWKLGVASLPRPRVASIDDLVAKSMDAQRVEVGGRVLGIVSRTGPETWVLEQDGALVLVSCLSPEFLPLKVGNEVRARGVCSLRLADDGRILGARLYLNSAADIVVTKAVPFWNRDRLAIAGILAGLMVASGMVWLWLLRRRVATQAKILQERFARLSALERLHGAVFSSLGEGIMVVDATGTIIEVNPAASVILGLPGDRLIGRKTPFEGDAVHPDGSPCSVVEVPINATLRTGRELSGVVLGLKRNNGETYWAAISSRPLLGSDGEKLAGAVTSFQDITEKVVAEREARRLETQLQQAQKMKALGTLAGGVAHDFNNLLGVILGNTSMARAEMDAGHSAQIFLEESLRACHRAADLVRQILAFSRKGDVRRQVVDLRPVVVEAVNLLRATIPTCVEISCTMPSRVAPVRCTASEIHQVVMNLCTNAWQSLEGRPGRIEVELADVADVSGIEPRVGRFGRGPHVRLSVRDTGKGIEEGVAERMFEPFFTTKPAGEGTGLGLAVVHGIVEAHGGVIALESAPGQGARFEIVLPASDEAAVPVDADAVLLVAPTGHGEAILIVDDEPGVARTVQLMLQRQGYDAECVLSPGVALERLRERPDHFRLMLTDLSMPVMTGCQLAMEARTTQPNLVVILMTGFGTDLQPSHLREAGIAEMILKPFSPETMAETIHRVLVARGDERLDWVFGSI
jgi:PAS domain S-box-containing protein